MNIFRTLLIYPLFLAFGYAQDVISVNVTSSAAHKLISTDEVGVVSVSNWNNIGLDGSDDAISGSTVNLSDAIDNSGANSGVTLTIGGAPFNYPNSTTITADPNTKMMGSARGSSSNGDGRLIQATSVPYDLYDIYVYYGGASSGASVPYVLNLKLQESDGSGGWQDMSPASDILYMRDTDRLWDGTYNESTATTAGDAVDGNEYVVFRNVTLDDFRVRTDTGVSRRSGIHGMQIVSVPEPSSLLLLVLGTALLVIPRKLRK